MRFPIASAITSLLIMCSVAAQAVPQDTTTSLGEMKVAPEVVLRLPSNFKAMPSKTAGLSEIVAQVGPKQSAYIKVTSEKRRSEEEARQRLLEVAQEAGGKRSFAEICGWPALERQYRVKLAQTMAEKTKEKLPEAPTVQAATIAISEGDTLVRFEATLQPGMTAEGLAPIFAAVRTVTCPANPNPGDTKATLEKLKTDLQQSPTGAKPASPANSAEPPRLTNSVVERERGTLASVQTSAGPSWSEIQIATSADGKTVVVGSNSGGSFSNNYGDSFSASTLNAPFSSGDPTLGTGVSGQFYFGGINLSGTGCAIQVDVDTTKTGATFNLAGNAAFSPIRGNIFFPDQPQMAVDGKNAAGGSDQLYVVWRNFTKEWWSSASTCTGINSGSPTPTISCSTNNGSTWGHQTAVGSGDLGRATVGPDGFVYVTYASGSNIMLNKFSSCASGLNAQPGFPVTVTSFSGVDCPIDGLDRCDSSATASPQPAVSMDFASSVFVAYADKTNGSNDNIVVKHSRDGGLTWPDSTVVNTGVSAKRELPWVCAGPNGANVSWYDRRAATAGDDSLTNYFFNTTSGTVVGTERNVSVSADSQKTAIKPCCPKYGDYNGNACTRDRVYVGWASATAPPGLPATGGVINVFVEAIPPGPPLVTAVAPALTQCGTGTTITISGANFRNVSRVELNNVSLPTISIPFVVSSTSVTTATVPGNLRGGVYEVVVWTASGSSTEPALGPHTDQFAVAPTVTSISPTSGPVTGATAVTVNGSCFETASRFFFGSVEGSRGFDQCASSTQCVIYSPAAAAASVVDITANANGAGSIPVAADRFTYAGPQITSVSPATGPLTGGTQVEIGGRGFPRYDGQTLLNTPMAFGAALTMAQCDQTWCMVLTPANMSAGAVNVVATAFGSSSAITANDVFTYTARPRLVRFDVPASPFFGATGDVNLDGNAPGGGAAVTLTSSNPSLVNVPGTVTIPAGHSGAGVALTINPSASNQAVTLTASYDGTTLTGTVNVGASPALSITIEQTTLSSGESSNVTVGLNSPAPMGGAVVTLTSNSGAITVPASETVLAGGYSTSFTVTNHYTIGPHIVTITAHYNGASAQDSVVVYVPPPPPGCRPQPCDHLHHWDTQTCRCEAGPPHLPQ